MIFLRSHARHSRGELIALAQIFSASEQKVIDHYSQVIEKGRIKHVMHPSNQDRTIIFPTRYSAEKGGIVDGN